MKKFNRYKVNASEVPALVGKDQDNLPPTSKDLEEFMRIIDKDELDISPRQAATIYKVISRTVNYDDYALSGSMKTELYKHYAYAMYKVGKVSLSSEKPLQLDKGEVAEPAAIKLLSKLDGIVYEKNQKLFSNNWFKGIPDVLLFKNEKPNVVKDIKICLDLPSFLARVDGDCLKDDAWEMRAYLDILDIKEGEICYCLVDMPEQYRKKRLSEHEQRYLLMGLSPEHIKRRLKQIEKSMMYDYISEDKRIKRFTVIRKSYFTKQMRNKVKAVRERLLSLHNKFENPVTLPETEESNHEDSY